VRSRLLQDILEEFAIFAKIVLGCLRSDSQDLPLSSTEYSIYVVNAIKNRSKQLEDAYRQLENTNVIQREFINIAAHELKTPIQPILGYAELLLEGESDDRKKHALMGIVHNSERLQKLASDILDVARMDSKRFQLIKKSLNLNSVISNIVKDYVKRLEQRQTRNITELISNVNGYSDDDIGNNGKTIESKLVFESKLKEDILFEADEERLNQVICKLVI